MPGEEITLAAKITEKIASEEAFKAVETFTKEALQEANVSTEFDIIERVQLKTTQDVLDKLPENGYAKTRLENLREGNLGGAREQLESYRSFKTNETKLKGEIGERYTAKELSRSGFVETQKEIITENGRSIGDVSVTFNKESSLPRLNSDGTLTEHVYKTGENRFFEVKNYSPETFSANIDHLKYQIENARIAGEKPSVIVRSDFIGNRSVLNNIERLGDTPVHPVLPSEKVQTAAVLGG